jgi:hypothetical protein
MNQQRSPEGDDGSGGREGPPTAPAGSGTGTGTGTGAAGPSSILERDHVRHLDL